MLFLKPSCILVIFFTKALCDAIFLCFIPTRTLIDLKPIVTEHYVRIFLSFVLKASRANSMFVGGNRKERLNTE